MTTDRIMRETWTTGVQQGAATTLVMLAAIYGLQYFDQILVGIFIQSIKFDLVLSDTQAGLLTGVAFTLFYAFLGFPLARIADRWDRKRLIILSVVTFSFATIACGLATTFWAFFAFRVLVAVGEAGTMPAAVSMLGEFFSQKNRRAAMSIHSSGGYLGTSLGLLLVGVLGAALTWRQTFVWAGGIGLLAAPLLIWGLRNPSGERVDRPSDTLWPDLQLLLRNKCFLLIMFGMGIGGIPAGSAINWTPAFLARSYGVGHREVVLFMAVAWGIGALSGSIILGLLANRLHRKGPRWSLGAVAVLVLLYPITFCLAFTANNVAWSMLGVGFGLFLMGGARGPVFATIQDIIPPQIRATATAVMMFAMYAIGTTFGPLLTGIASDALSGRLGNESLRAGMFAVSLTAGLIAFGLFVAAARALEETLRDVGATAASRAEMLVSQVAH